MRENELSKVRKKIKKVVDKWRGKDKINVLDIQEINGGQWRVRFEEDGGNITYVDFPEREEAEEFTFTFGGKNNLTVAADPKYLELTGWDYNALRDLGHICTSITIDGEGVNNTMKIVEHKVPKGCGLGHLPGKKTKGKLIIKEAIEYRERVREKVIVFTDPEELDCFRDWIYDTCPKYKINVLGAVTQNVELGIHIKWKRRKVGDGTLTNEFRAIKINNKPYELTRFMDIMRACDEMVEKTCRRLFMNKRPNWYEGCATAAEEGRITVQ